MKRAFIFLLLGLSAQMSFSQNGTKRTTTTQPAKTGPDQVQVAQRSVPATSLKEVVAIYPFTTSREYSYDYALSVGTAVEAGFVRSGRFTVVERNRFGSMSAEDQFREANTADIVKKAERFGAKTIVTGHIVGVSHGDIVDYNRRPTGDVYVEVSLSFKIIDVETGTIKTSEIIRGKGTATTPAAASQNAYLAIDNSVRNYVAQFMPQRFRFMSILKTEVRKKDEILTLFKLWGGSENGIKPGDVVGIYSLSYVIDPTTNKKIEEKNNIGLGTITEVNSGSTATCELYKPQKYGASILELLKKAPDQVVLEYAGGAKPKNFWGF